MQRPTHCYLGLSKDGELEIFVADRSLNPIGNRLLRGEGGWPHAVTQFYTNPTLETATEAVRSAEAFLKGEEAGMGSLTIGDTSPLTAKRRRKS